MEIKKSHEELTDEELKELAERNKNNIINKLKKNKKEIIENAGKYKYIKMPFYYKWWSNFKLKTKHFYYIILSNLFNR
jgi:hypothetical protein